MKKCFKCGIEKSLDNFYKHKKMSDGRLNKCKECTKKDSKDNDKNNSKSKESYDKTEKGVIRVIYKTQKRHSKLRGHLPPLYTKEELKEWLYLNGFKRLYDNWAASNYDKFLKPSVDRKNDFRTYTIDNIVLGTWRDNINHFTNDAINGINKHGRKCKPVLCYNSNKELIAEYVSFSSARRAVGYSMERSLKYGNKDRKNGFYWKYK